MLRRLAFFLLAAPAVASSFACTVHTGPLTEPAPRPAPSAPSAPRAESPTTADVETRDLLPQITATEERGAVTIVVRLFSHGVALPLGAGDYLTATVGTVTQSLRLTGDLGTYSARFVERADEGLATIAFERGAVHVSAPKSVVSFAPSFDLEAPPSVAGRDASISFTVRPTTNGWVGVTASGPCVSPAHTPTVVFLDAQSKGSLVDGVDWNAKGCAVTVNVSEQTHGAFDPAFGRGPGEMDSFFVGEQVRSFVSVVN
jgi:hypothetical protein